MAAKRFHPSSSHQQRTVLARETSPALRTTIYFYYMIGQHLHIITFDVPYPANYGGAIDVYYRIKALHAYGVHIILHCFHKENIATRYPELESLCEKVHYYQRSNKLFDHIHFQPFVVRSRRSKDLLNNLLQDNFPILFEGLVSCYLINHPLLHLRKKYFRECNASCERYDTN